MKSIRVKLPATYAALIILTVLLLGSGFIWFLRVFYLETVKQRLLEEARLMRELLKPALSGTAGGGGTGAYIRELSKKAGVRITLVDSDGTVLGDSHEDAALMDNHNTRPEIREAGLEGAGSAVRYSRTLGMNMLYVAVPVEAGGGGGGYLRLALPLSSLNQALRRVQYALLAGLLAVLALTMAISLKLAAGFTRPLEEVAEVAARISAGDLQCRVFIQDSNELGELAVAVNAMAEALEKKLGEITAGRDRLDAILNNMQEGIIVFGGDGRAVLANPAAERMLGSGREGLLGRRDLEIVRNLDLHGKMEAVRKDGEPREQLVSISFPEKKTLSVSLAPVKEPGGDGGILAVFHDITRMMQLEQMRADFAANVSHELRTPLTAIRGFAETISESAYSDAEAARRFAAIIQKEAERLAALIEDVLTLSRIESGRAEIKFTAIQASELIREVTGRMAGRFADRKLQLKVGENLPAVYGDSGLLGQALYNLLDNAEKYTHSGGLITVGAAREGDKVKLFVEDNGIGIPAAAQERIFERFYRVDRARSRRMGGTGLGLAIVKHIVEVHRGQLKLTSSEGKGTRVEIILAAAPTVNFI